MIWLSMRTTSSMEGAFGGIDVIFGKQLINSWIGGFKGGRGTAGTRGASLAGLFSRFTSLSRSLSLSSSLFDPLPLPLPPFPPPLPPDDVPARAKKRASNLGPLRTIHWSKHPMHLCCCSQFSVFEIAFSCVIEWSDLTFSVFA